MSEVSRHATAWIQAVISEADEKLGASYFANVCNDDEYEGSANGYDSAAAVNTEIGENNTLIINSKQSNDLSNYWKKQRINY